MKDRASDYVAMLALVLASALLCLVVYQDMTMKQALEAIVYLREHCRIIP